MAVQDCVEQEAQVARERFDHGASSSHKSSFTRPTPVFLLTALALLVRLILLVASHGFTFFVEEHNHHYTSMMNETTNIASSIASGHGFGSPMAALVDTNGGGWTGPSSWIAPVYPYLCAGVFKLFGIYSQQSFLVIILLQCMISALIVVPIVLIGKETVGARTGYISAFIWAVFPWFSTWAITWVWEISLSAFLSAVVFWCALQFEGHANYKRWMGLGALWGLVLLVNPALLTLLVMSGIWIVYTRWRKKLPWLRPAILACIACVLVTSPWIVRNRMVFGQWTFIRSNFGFEFGLGNYHGSNGRGWGGHHPAVSREEYAAYSKMGERAYLEWKTQLARQFVKEHPREFLTLTAKRTLWFWDGSVMRYNYPINRMWMPWSFVVFSIALLPALLLAIIRRVKGWMLFTGFLVLYPIPYYLAYSQVRYRHAIEPLMLLLVVYGVVQWWDWLRCRMSLSLAR
jgi:4-amino-4-deoxy-L-arabinose transferase-like glycosyltransferase